MLPIERYVPYQDAVLGALHMRLAKAEVADTSAIPQTFADEFGWPGLAHAVERASATLTPEERAHAAIYTQNYGEAGAVDFFGTEVPPAISGHKNYYLWGPHGATTLRVAPEVLWQHVRHYDSMPLESDAGYDCPSCNEHNYVAVDPSGGSRQKLIEDCPVCCRPLVFTVTIDRDGDAIVESVERE